MVTCTKRSLDLLRRHGYIAAVTEQNVHIPDREHPGKTVMFKRDLWNLADLVAVREDEQGTTYVQTTTTAHQADRIAKVQGLDVARVLLKSGNQIHVHGWMKSRKTGRWTVTVTRIVFDRQMGGLGAVPFSYDGEAIAEGELPF